MGMHYFNVGFVKNFEDIGAESEFVWIIYCSYTYFYDLYGLCLRQCQIYLLTYYNLGLVHLGRILDKIKISSSTNGLKFIRFFLHAHLVIVYNKFHYEFSGLCTNFILAKPPKHVRRFSVSIPTFNNNWVSCRFLLHGSPSSFIAVWIGVRYLLLLVFWRLCKNTALNLRSSTSRRGLSRRALLKFVL